MNKRIFLFIALFALSIQFASAISLSVSIDPSTNVTTTNALDCQVTATATGVLTGNITWYQNGAAHGTDNETLSFTSSVQNSTTSTGRIEIADTSKNDVWICQVTVGNGTNVSIQNSSSVTIANSAPILTYPTTIQTVYEDQAAGPILATATDPDGDPIVSFISADLNSSYYGSSLFTIGANGTISFTPTVDAVGNHTMALLASDGDLIGGQNVIYQVIAVNDTPVLEFIPAYVATEGTQLNIGIIANDEENDDINYSIVSSLGTIQIVKVNRTYAVINFTSGAPTFSDGGIWTVTVYATQFNNASQNDSQMFTLTVNTTNQVPQFTNWTTPNGTQGNFYQINVSANDSDTTDELVFNVTSPCSLTNPWSITTLLNGSTNATGQINATNLTNDHIACRNITIQVTDYGNVSAKVTTNLSLLLNLTNTNDAPVIYEMSYNGTNTGNLNNISNLSAAIDILYSYTVNASDVDSLTYEGETINFTDNTTLFDINSTTGLIRFTPNSSVVGNHTVNITVQDDGGLNDSITLFIQILNNSVPIIATLPNMTCNEDQNCTTQINYTDPDGDTMTYTLTPVSSSTPYNNTPSTSLARINGTNNFTVWKNYTNDIQGNYTFNITVTDVFGAQDSVLWTIFVNNVNDAPFFDNDLNRSVDTLEIPDPVVIEYETIWYINASDDDFNVTTEILSVSMSLAGPNTTLFNVTNVSAQQWLINFTPYAASIGDYSLNLTVLDDEGGNTTQTINFTVYNQSLPPVIQTVTPFYNATSMGLDTGWESASTLGGSTAITLSEGSTYNFNLTWTDADDTAANITIYWYRDGTLIQTSPATGAIDYSLTLDYFSAGTYVYTANVTDFTRAYDVFQWNVTVTNVNRQPVFTGTLADREINATTVLTDYLSGFVDPDDDLDSNGMIDGSEINRLTFTSTSSSLLTISFSGDDVTLEPVETGTATITYTGTDSGSLSADSNIVTYNVTFTEEETETTSSSSSSSGGGGGGGGGSSSVLIPVASRPEPYSIEILTPEPLSIYFNQTIAAPLIVSNPSEQSLREITLTAVTTSEDVGFDFSETYIQELVPDESRNITLFITNYRDPGNYEIIVTASVADPEVNDTAIIFINSLDQSQDGDDIQSRVTFARDLLAANPECAELHELIDQAQRAIDTRQNNEAQKLLNTVIDGCRYLVSQAAQREEVPAGYDLDWLMQFRYANYVLAGLIILVLGIGAMLITHYVSSHRKEDE